MTARQSASAGSRPDLGNDLPQSGKVCLVEFDNCGVVPSLCAIYVLLRKRLHQKSHILLFLVVQPEKQEKAENYVFKKLGTNQGK